jgi:hypothetical protein
MAQDRVQWRALVLAVLNLRVLTLGDSKLPLFRFRRAEGVSNEQRNHCFSSFSSTRNRMAKRR